MVMMRKTILLLLTILCTATLLRAQQTIDFTQPAEAVDTPVKASRFQRINRKAAGTPFGYKGEFLIGLTASYGTLSSEDTLAITSILPSLPVNASG